jgi:hypothetical protein
MPLARPLAAAAVMFATACGTADLTALSTAAEEDQQLRKSCGNGVCNAGESCSKCPQDCGACPPPAVCGDGTCASSESCQSCAADCGACPASCGDGSCNGDETCASCSSDCGACPAACGDGTCGGTETCSSCSTDCGACPPPDAGVGDVPLKVASVRRLTPPSYGATTQSYAVREAWNRDMTRLMYYEGRNPTPEGIVGMVWGFESDLTRWTNDAEYHAARHPLYYFNGAWNVFSEHLEWSIFDGENGIMYAVYKPTRMLVRRDLDANTITNIVSIDPGNGTNVTGADPVGWTTNGTLIVNLGGLDDRTLGAWEIDVKTGGRTFYASTVPTTTADKLRWPCLSHGHGMPSPDRTLYADYGAGRLYDFRTGATIVAFPSQYAGLSGGPGQHVSWKASNRWWVAESFGIEAYRLVLDGVWPASQPFINHFELNQCFTDGTCSNLLVTGTAAYWSNNGTAVWNYEHTPIPALRRDGRAVLFASTDGKYSYTDFTLRGVTPWDYGGVFLARLAPK